MYVNQIIMLYTLNLYSAVYHLYLNETQWKKKKLTGFKRRLYIAGDSISKCKNRSIEMFKTKQEKWLERTEYSTNNI